MQGAIEMKEKNIQLIKKIADSLLDQNIKFRFLDERWKREGDVDLIVAAESLDDFDHVMKKNNFVLREKWLPWSHYYRGFFNEEFLKIHVHVGKYQGLPVGILEPKGAAGSRGYFLSTEEQIFYFVYKLALKEPLRKYEEYLYKLVRKGVDKKKLYDLLACVFRNPAEVLQCIQKAEFSRLNTKFKFSHNLPRAKMYALNKIAIFVQRIRKSFSPAPYIAIIGPDGSGKTSTLSAVASTLRGHGISFARVSGSRFHFQVLPLNWVFEKVEKRRWGEEEIVSNHARRYPSSLLQIILPFLYSIEYQLRHLLIIRPLKKRNQVVIADRSFIDVVVSPNTHTTIAKTLYGALSKPDATIYLFNTVDVLAKRKPEHPRHNLEAQLKAYSSLTNFFTQKIKTTNKKKVREEVFALIVSRCSLPREEGKHWLWF